MEQSLLQKVKEQLLRHEGLRFKPYRCPAGKLTIGIGRNLNDRGESMNTHDKFIADGDPEFCANTLHFRWDPHLHRWQ